MDTWWDYFDPQSWTQAPPSGPVLLPSGGGGGERVRSQSYWVWPLPPDGPLAFVVEWPALGVPLTQAHVDATLIRQAAAQNERLWQRIPTMPDQAVLGGQNREGSYVTTLRGNQIRLRLPPWAARTAGLPEGADAPLVQSREAHHPARPLTPPREP